LVLETYGIPVSLAVLTAPSTFLVFVIEEILFHKGSVSPTGTGNYKFVETVAAC
jgi:hypothetical protein